VPFRVEDIGGKIGPGHYDVAHAGNPNADVRVSGFRFGGGGDGVASRTQQAQAPARGGAPQRPPP
jgi:hypothetical protein